MKTNLPESKYLFDDRAPMAFSGCPFALSRVVMMALRPFPLSGKIYGCGYLWQHGCKFKLALADIILCLVNAHALYGLFILACRNLRVTLSTLVSIIITSASISLARSPVARSFSMMALAPLKL